MNKFFLSLLLNDIETRRVSTVIFDLETVDIFSLPIITIRTKNDFATFNEIPTGTK